MDKVKEDVFTVEKVLKSRKYKGQVQCLVKWANWSNRYNSWVPSADIFQVQPQDTESASRETQSAAEQLTAGGKPAGQDKETTAQESEPPDAPKEEEASVSSNTLGETPADTTVSRVATSSQFPKVRKYTTWGDEKTIVDNYFASYIEQNKQKRLPGKKEVMKFLSLHPDFPHDHKVIHARVMNRVYASEKMAKDRLKKMNTY